MLVLALDTATSTASLALLSGRRILAEIFLDTGKHHGETLLPVMEELLKRSGIRIDAVGLLVFTIGPGSFTGLRIGASTVKGLAFAMQIPVVGVSTLEALAWNVSMAARPVCPMLDAQREEVYTALFRPTAMNELEVIAEERAVIPEDFLPSLPADTIFLGSGALKHVDLIRKIMPGGVTMASSHLHHVRAGIVGLIGLQKFIKNGSLNSSSFVPRYLRVSEAERKKREELHRK